MIEQPMPTVVEDVPELAERPSAADEADIMAAAPLSARRRFLRRFKSNKGAMIAFGFIVFLLIIAVIGPWIAPYDPNAQDLANTLADPLTGGHILGTDELGSRHVVAADRRRPGWRCWRRCRRWSIAMRAGRRRRASSPATSAGSSIS